MCDVTFRAQFFRGSGAHDSAKKSITNFCHDLQIQRIAALKLAKLPPRWFVTPLMQAAVERQKKRERSHE